MQQLMSAIVLTASSASDDIRTYVERWGYNISGVCTSTDQATRLLTSPTGPPGAIFVDKTGYTWLETIAEKVAEDHVAVFFLPQEITSMAGTT